MTTSGDKSQKPDPKKTEAAKPAPEVKPDTKATPKAEPKPAGAPPSTPNPSSKAATSDKAAPEQKPAAPKAASSKASVAGKPAPEPVTPTQPAKAAADKTPSTSQKATPAKSDASGPSSGSPKAPGATNPDPSPKPDATTGAADATSKASDAPKKSHRLAWTSLVMVVLLIGAGLSGPYWAGYVEDILPDLYEAEAPAEDPRVDTLVGRMDALETRASELETARSDTVTTLETERAAQREDLTAALARIEGLEQALKETRQVVEATMSVDQASAANESLKALQDRLVELEAGGADVGALTERLDRLEQQRLDQGNDGESRDAELASSLQTVTDRLQQLEDKPPPLETAAITAQVMVLTVTQLRDRVSKGLPYENELQAVGALTGDATPDVMGAMEQLQAHAAEGVLTVSRLVDSFPDAADQARAALVAEEGDPKAAPADEEAPVVDTLNTWVNRARDSLSSLVQVRDIGADQEDAATEFLIRAETALASNDLTGAVTALADAPAPAQAALAAWLTSAEARLVVEKALAQLNVYAVSQLQSAPAGG